MTLQYEESYDIESELSEDDRRSDPIPPNGYNTNGNTEKAASILFNESMTMCLNDDEDEDHMNIDNSPNKKAASIRSESIAIDFEIHEDTNGNNIIHNHSTRPMRSQTIEIHSNEKEGIDSNFKNKSYNHYDNYDNYDNTNFGRCYRQCCFSSFGIKITIILNVMMILLNSSLIIYEIILVIRDDSVMHTQLPLWYMICDFIVTIILFIEILFLVGAIYHCNICKYFASGWECWIDIVVLLLSIGCCIAYYFDFTSEDVDNLTMLFVRVIRDIIRIVRCLWFFKMLYSNLIRLGIRKHSKATDSTFHGEPLLANKAWKSKYKLQINHSPKSTTSDQREYKGPKRVDIYDQNDIENIMNNQDKKLKHRKMYSLTPSPPNIKTTTPHKTNLDKKYSNSHSRNKNRSRIISSPSRGSHQRNITRNCDEFRITIDDGENLPIYESNMNRISDDRSDIISINSGIMPGSNGSIIRHNNHIHHRQTSTKILDARHDSQSQEITEPINSYGDGSGDGASALSYLTTGTNDNYYENLRLRQIKKKTVDKQRLRDILRNLPSGSFDKPSFSIPDDSDDDDDDMPMVGNITLHGDHDKLQII